MKAFEKFIRSRNGMLSLFGALIILLLIVAYFNGAFGGITGTAGIPVPNNPHYDMPATDGNYTCLPTCVDNDAKMFILAGSNQATMSNAPIKVWIMSPGDQPSFKLGIFDGDTSKASDNTLKYFADGRIDYRSGNWDDATDSDTTYTLYADPLADGSGQTALASWKGNDVMLNNAWWETTINRNEQAKAPNGHYYYRLEATRDVNGKGGQAFKVRATGYVFTGQRPEWSVGLTGMLNGISDVKIIYPESKGNINKLGSQMTYDGDWKVYFYVPDQTQTFQLWDGDFDRGNKGPSADTDDPDSPGKPAWATKFAVDQGVGGVNHDGVGNPQDDNPINYYRVSPSVKYEILDPTGNPIYTNDNPSGTEEWEKFLVDPNAADKPDVLINSPLKPGMYTFHIMGLDLHNYIWLGVSYPICDPNGGCPPPPWFEGSCPRTIGYWKNNVAKVLANQTNGIQESADTLNWGLRNVALASPIFRHGINVQHPVAIANPAPLTLDEANLILQRDQKTYPGGKDQANSMLARALQQNLAVWLNMATGKIGPYAIVTINVPSGAAYTGSMMGALRTAETIILNNDSSKMEYAKDIADLINNAQINVDPSTVLACTAYTTVVPPDQQPPSHKDMPKGPKPTPEPVTPEPFVTPEAPVCRPADYNYGQGYAIIALDPADCQGEQNGLLFHGTSSTTVSSAYSAGCLRSVGTHSVKGAVDFIGPSFGDMSLINPAPTQITTPLPESAWKIAAPDCSDPAAHQMDGKDFKGDMLLEPGLYCITGDATINAGDTVQGSGVTLFMNDGKFTVNGGAFVNLTAPEGEGVSPALPGVLLYMADSNSNVVEIDGNSDSWYQGTIYAPKSEINVLGTGQVHGGWAQFIGWDVQVGGTADVWLDYMDKGLPACTK